MSRIENQVLDSIFKLYRNSSGKIIGVHEISIIEQRPVIPDPRPGQVNKDRFQRSVKLEIDFRRVNNTIGESRTISSVQYYGKYDDFKLNNAGNDIAVVTYLGVEGTNDIEVSLSEFPTVGDIL